MEFGAGNGYCSNELPPSRLGTFPSVLPGVVVDYKFSSWPAGNQKFVFQIFKKPNPNFPACTCRARLEGHATIVGEVDEWSAMERE
ncbi:unnamed protein product [Blepharisma stoltei]|uniref:Uncharacterized protein n=1 Tax=Blepharisma stoltei TaxID=1481888 RepID=A0AAU9IHQ2_9CILI|nr:unnamed protein product [Blepharisma stoltei]